MRCLLRYVVTFIEVLYFLSLMTASSAYGHVGERCTFMILFHVCMASNAYCDNNNICRCKSDYPVKVNPHTCKKPLRYGERCTVSAECRYSDSNSYCTQLSYRSVCDCLDGYRHDSNTDNCAKVEKAKSSSPNLVLPMAVGLSLALACLICCCLASVHICRVRRRHRCCRRSARAVSRIVDTEGVRWDPRAQTLPSTPSAPEDLGTLPSYDVAVTLQPMKDQDENPEDLDDELPPSYDEVIKNS